MKSSKNIRDLVVFKKLTVKPAVISPKKISSTYSIETKEGTIISNELIYSYEEEVFDADSPDSQNLASMILSQLALNYGLFCKEIHFDGLFDDADKKFLSDKMENTSREIYINKFIKPNEFLLPEYQDMVFKKLKHYTSAKLFFLNSKFRNTSLKWKMLENDHNRYLILSSGGKDSLLSYGVLNEIGKEVHPVFINESGRHWYTALNTFRYLKNKNINTARVWCNSDRIYNWILRQMAFIRKDFNRVRADDYPVRLWTVAVFIFGVLPIARKRKIGRIIIGDEYDSTQKLKLGGLTHYNGYFDQSRFFDNALSRYYMKKGWAYYQFSILRSLSELLIMEILVKRYPELQQHQISCHAASEKNGRIYPCGKCEKCRRIVGMLKALDEDPKRCGYTDVQIMNSLNSLSSKGVKQIGSDAAYLYKLLIDKVLIDKNPFTLKIAKDHEEIRFLRFDNERSMLSDIPVDLRKEIFSA